ASPLATSLSALGLTADDIEVVSKHDTSTNANDPNESELHERLASAIGRSEGNPLYVISQKPLTGHSKGGAAAFQLIALCQVLGLRQALSHRIAAPNRRLDCGHAVLAVSDRVVGLREPLGRGPSKAAVLTGLGFGHESRLPAVAHPQALLSALPDSGRAEYM